MRRLCVFLFAAIVAGSSFFSVQAEETENFFGPFLSRTQHPLLLTTLALLPTTSEPRAKNETAISLQTVHSNLFERILPATGTGIDLDMELWRTSLFFERGLTDAMDLTLEMPFLHSGGGFLDGFIQSYHEQFGFLNGGREQVDNGRFSYRVTESGTTLYDVSEAGMVPSDWTLSLKTKLYSGNTFKLAAQHLVSIPLGNPNSGAGSHLPGFGFSLVASGAWNWFKSTTQIGASVVPPPEALDSLMRPLSLGWMQNFEFKLIPSLSLLIQAQGETPRFKNTDTAGLTVVPLDLIIGFSGTAFERDTRHLFWQVGFSEDPLGKGASIDFSSYLRVGYVF